jgi:protein O-GlcNAc transferase
MTTASSVDDVLQQAIAHHRAGQLQQAESLYRAMLAAFPNHPDAHHNLGVLARQVGKDLDALPFFKASFATNPSFVQYVESYASALVATDQVQNELASLFGASEYTQLEILSRAIIEQRPDAGIAWKMLGVALQLQSKSAMPELCKAVELLPNDPDCHLNLASALVRAGKRIEALGHYQTAIALKPDFWAAHNNLGLNLLDLKRFDEAARYFRQALIIKPDFAKSHYFLGLALRELGRHEEAIVQLNRAIELNPSDADTHCELGVALIELKQFRQAADCFARAIECQPTLALAHNNLGAALIELGQLESALIAIREAVRLAPDWIDALTNLAMVQRELCQMTDSELSFRKALELKPDQDYLFGNWIHTRLKICAWENLDQYIEELESRTKNSRKALTPFSSLSISSSRSVQAKAAAISAQADFSHIEELPLTARRSGRDKIRLGYFSADFYQHATGILMAELFERHDRDRFELYAYSFGPISNDPLQRRLMAAFDHFIDVRQSPDRDVALLARQHELDIAIDLKGYTQSSRTGIFAWRAAPVQVNYIGYPGTMNVPFMDYVIADPTLIPEAHQSDYSEKVVYLPNSYQVNDRQRRVSDLPLSRAHMGLPDQAFVFCCFNNNYKILPATFDSWMRILQAVDGSVLWLFEDNPGAAMNLRKEAERRGVSADRLVFAQRIEASEHLARQRLADLFLDTLPYNAHTTASDALWVGLPVLTLIGDTFAGRVAASLLNAIRVPELITATPAEFEEKAIALARDRAALGAIKEKLTEHRLTTPLFDATMFARHLEAAFSEMVERHQAGLAPEHIHVAGD